MKGERFYWWVIELASWLYTWADSRIQRSLGI